MIKLLLTKNISWLPYEGSASFSLKYDCEMYFIYHDIIPLSQYLSRSGYLTIILDNVRYVLPSGWNHYVRHDKQRHLDCSAIFKWSVNWLTAWRAAKGVWGIKDKAFGSCMLRQHCLTDSASSMSFADPVQKEFMPSTVTVLAMLGCISKTQCQV